MERNLFGIRLFVCGPYALFTRPEDKAEPYSYDLMTPSAARGVLDSIYWKPAIRWQVDAIHVLKPIQFQTIKRNEVGSKISADTAGTAMRRGSLDGLSLYVDVDRQQRSATVLRDVAYAIEAHFERTDRAGPDDTDGKHLDIFNRRAARGQNFHQPSLGTREFAAEFKLLPRDEPMPTAIPESRDLGLMLYDIDYARPGRRSIFFHARLDHGVLRVPAPDAVEVLR